MSKTHKDAIDKTDKDTITTANVERWTRRENLGKAQRSRVDLIERELESAGWPKAIFEGQVFSESSGNLVKDGAPHKGNSGENSIIQILPRNLKAYNDSLRAKGLPPVSISGDNHQHIAVRVANATTFAFARDYLEDKNPKAAQAGGYDNMYLRLQCYNHGAPAVTASLGKGELGKHIYPAKVAAYLLFKAEQYKDDAPDRAAEYRDAYTQIRDGAIKAGRKDDFDTQTTAQLGKGNWLDAEFYQAGARAYITALNAPEGAKAQNTGNPETPTLRNASGTAVTHPQAVNGATGAPAANPTPVAPEAPIVPAQAAPSTPPQAVSDAAGTPATTPTAVAPAAAPPAQAAPATLPQPTDSPPPLSVRGTQRYFQTSLEISTGGVGNGIGPRTRNATEIVETALVNLGHLTKANTYLGPSTRKLLAKPEIQAELKAVFAGIPGVLESISGGEIDRVEVLAGVAPLRTQIEQNARHVVAERQKGIERN